MVSVRLFGPVAQVVGHKTVEVDASNLSEVLHSEVLAPASGLFASCRFARNGQIITEISVDLQPDDEIAILPPVGGGCGVKRTNTGNWHFLLCYPI